MVSSKDQINISMSGAAEASYVGVDSSGAQGK